MTLFINKSGELKVRVRGVDRAIRWAASHGPIVKKGAQQGTIEAAEYLQAIIEEKIGSYQSTGGSGGGPWARLKFETIARKLRRYGIGDKPLLASGALRDSFYVKPGGKGTISASVASTDPKLPHHVGGVSKRGVPQRDPMMVTALEEMDMCHDIIEDAVLDAINRM